MATDEQPTIFRLPDGIGAPAPDYYEFLQLMKQTTENLERMMQMQNGAQWQLCENEPMSKLLQAIGDARAAWERTNALCHMQEDGENGAG